MDKAYMKDWNMDGDIVNLLYSDYDVVKVSKMDFNRAFGAILNAPKEAVVRDFGISSDARMIDWKENGAVVELYYSDNDIVKVSKEDFNRAFGAILNAKKDAVKRDFGIKTEPQKASLAEQISAANDKKAVANEGKAEIEKAYPLGGLYL